MAGLPPIETIRQRVRAIEQATMVTGVGLGSVHVAGSKGREISSGYLWTPGALAFPGTESHQSDVIHCLEETTSPPTAYSLGFGQVPPEYFHYSKSWNGWTLDVDVCPANGAGYMPTQQGISRHVLGGQIGGVGQKYGIYAMQDLTPSQAGPYSESNPPIQGDIWLMSDPYMTNPPNVSGVTAGRAWCNAKPPGHGHDFVVRNSDGLSGYLPEGWSGVGNLPIYGIQGWYQPMSTVQIAALCQIGTPQPFNVQLCKMLRAGATILGAWAEVYFGDLMVIQERLAYQCAAIWYPYPTGTFWEWQAPTWEHDGPISPTAGQVGFAVTGIKRGGLWGSHWDILTTVDPPTGGFVVAGQSHWVDLTTAVRAVQQNWFGKGYAEFGLIPFDPNTNHMLSASEVWPNSQMLARLWPQMKLIGRRSTDPDKVYGANFIDWEIATKLIVYKQMTVTNLCIAFELPASSVGRLLPYGDYPSLVPP